MFEITSDDIALLNDEDLRALVGLLCESEVRSRGFSASLVTWGGNQNAADGGVDVRVRVYDEQFDINIKGAYFTIQKALPLLNDGASIILNTSVAGSTGTVGASVYSATKAALRSLARTPAAELVGRGIRVNAVAPGPIVTPIFGRTGLPKDAIDEFAKDVVARVPMKRFGQPEEVAGAVAFLASQDASYITGVEINVDGGYGQI
jgi:NAD(P)-dependent dehydrogenase (short-subunit alcohol dehydrogenase family)